MKNSLTVAIAAISLAASASPAFSQPTPKPGADGWISMFDGKSLAGWKANERPESWKVVDGAIVGDGPASHLFWMERECEDCEFRAEVKLNHSGNSGMYLRTAMGPGFPKGYEAQVENTSPDPQKTGSLYNICKVTEQLIQDDTWWTQHITIQGNHVVIKINDKVITDCIDPQNRYTKGYLALQQHNAGSIVQYRNLMMRPLAATAAHAEQGALELTSGLGRKLYALPDNDALIEARRNLAANPKSADLAIKLSKAQAARRQYKEAVATSTRALSLTPDNADLYLERGHRELGLRDFRPAMHDLEHAAKLAPENLDAHYHLGLAHYFLMEFDQAAASFDEARALAKSNDSLIDCSNWLYVSLRRANKEQQAAKELERITADVKNTEPHLYFYLRLLRFYQGHLTREQVMPAPPSGPQDLEGELSFNTVSYGVGNWLLYHGKRPAAADVSKDAADLFKKVVTGEAWNSWGFIGSELELVRANK